MPIACQDNLLARVVTSVPRPYTGMVVNTQNMASTSGELANAGGRMLARQRQLREVLVGLANIDPVFGIKNTDAQELAIRRQNDRRPSSALQVRDGPNVVSDVHFRRP